LPLSRQSLADLTARARAALDKPISRSTIGRVLHRDAIKPWGVQVAAGFGRDKALFMYAQAMKELTAVIGAQGEPILFRSRGTSSFYQVRIGAGTRREANDLCGRIRRTGGACLVKRRQA